MSESELCRLCAETKDELIGIYDAEGQKLAIEGKIAKCLQIQVVITDNLPLSVCFDCCVLLNQCNDFYEKTNQAQSSLRQLLTEPKSEALAALEPNIEYIEKTVEYPKVESEEVVEEFSPSDNYVTETVEDMGDEYFHDENEDSEADEKYKDLQENSKKKYKNEEKKGSGKQTKKKLKKRSQSRKMSNSDIGATNSENDEYQSEIGNSNEYPVSKAGVKIPDNYMTGTDSDMEMIEARAAEPTKPGRKRGEGLTRNPWLCTDCNDKMPSLEMLEEHHETVHNQQAKYMCVQCCKIFDKYYGFLIHVNRHKNKSKFSCDECGKSFVHKKVLDSHKAVHSEERPHVCQTCGKAFRQQSALYIHGRCHLPETMKNRFPCDQCDKRFSTKPNLVTHQRIHSGVRNFTCDQCGKSFIQKGNLEAHFLTHSADKPYTCSQCPKAFKTPLQLKKHETVHTGAKPHQCAVCGRTFREKGTLREHHRIHTGAMPFTCEFCGKCFRFKGILTTHRRQHTGERPYSCLDCQHHFTNWPNYNKHMKRRHGINTSHTKYVPQPQQQSQTQQQNESESSSALPRQTPATIQVIQAVPHASISQPIVVQSVPTTTSFPTEVPVTGQDTAFRERNTTTFFNTVPLQNLLPGNLPHYNFYNISNVTESDIIQHR
ncbi:zinc finger protein 3 homolog [Venturia canescens]|uniref:zinc finger protein 3 homolog n=1 Tax=Venturia canescens TaxID=32260 RepID=UPI001C9D20CE|nr:zinc finger protein 3 homolog [Venturia canescens]